MKEYLVTITETWIVPEDWLNSTDHSSIKEELELITQDVSSNNYNFSYKAINE